MREPPTIIVGAGGQDGKILSKALAKKGKVVLGISEPRNELPEFLKIDISNFQEVCDLISERRPDKIYYLAAHHGSSERHDQNTTVELYEKSYLVNVKFFFNFLCAVQKLQASCKLFYASSSLIFSGRNGFIQDEETAIDPMEIYGLTKAEGLRVSDYFRTNFNIFSSVGILYNHESVYRGNGFLSSKVIRAAISITNGSSEKLTVGALDHRVDWSYAPDIVDAFQEILDLERPGNFIIGSGELHTVREFIDLVFRCFDLDYRDHISEDTSLLSRPPTVRLADITKIKRETKWRPRRSFQNFVESLVRDHIEIGSASSKLGVS